MNDKWDIELIDLIFSDLEQSRNDLNSTDSQYARRNYIRSFFSALEGSLFILRSDTIKQIDRNNYNISRSEESFIREESYQLDKKKLTSSSSQKFIPLNTMLRFTFKHHTAAHGVDYSIDLQSEGWCAFKKALKVRNRITHPKNPSHFNVSNADLENTNKAYQWIVSIYEEISNIADNRNIRS